MLSRSGYVTQAAMNHRSNMLPPHLLVFLWQCWNRPSKNIYIFFWGWKIPPKYIFESIDWGNICLDHTGLTTSQFYVMDGMVHSSYHPFLSHLLCCNVGFSLCEVISCRAIFFVSSLHLSVCIPLSISQDTAHWLSYSSCCFYGNRRLWSLPTSFAGMDREL